MESSNPSVTFSFQGAFGPPTLGHYTAMKLYARKVLLDYPGAERINMLFMPTALSSSKPHLEVTQRSRLQVLEAFCRKLQEEPEFLGTPIFFSPSDIEYTLCESNRDTGTYRTIDKLHEDYPENILLLGMGFDNMLQLPYWKHIKSYKDRGIKTIYVANRELTEIEKAKTRKFLVNGSVLNFDITIPRWGETTYQQAREGFGIEGDSSEELTQALQAKLGDNMEEIHELTFASSLPEIVIVGGPEEEQIPATSSSMMRYYICNFIKDRNPEYREKVRMLMWGTNPIEEGVDATIEDYRTIYSEGSDCPSDDDYNKKYHDIFSAKASGGRKKTYKKRKYYKKNRTHKKRSTRKLSGKRRRFKYSKKN